MRFRPILYSTAMVQANHDGRKNQTRRANGLEWFNGRPIEWRYDGIDKDNPSMHYFEQLTADGWPLERYHPIICPYGQVGDVLWVRETFIDNEDYPCWADEDNEDHGKYTFKAEGPSDQMQVVSWRPSIHMPAAACRSWCIITGIECQRLQDISRIDAINEGIEVLFYFKGDKNCPAFKDYSIRQPKPDDDGWSDPVVSFQSLWQSINGKESWEVNPWVWVVRYEHTTTPPKGWDEHFQHIEISNLKKHINKDLKPNTPEFKAAREKLMQLIDASKKRAK